MRLEYTRVVSSKHDKDSFLAIVPETFGSKASLGTIEVSHPYGFASRPVDKDDEGGACGAYYGIDGAQGFAWLANDGRIQAKLPEIQEGESFQYGVTGNFARCHKDGRVSLFTTDDATVDGRTVSLTVGPTGLVFNAPWGNLKFDATGFHVLHSSGARIDLGACGGLPAPFDALASYATMSAAITKLEGSMVNLGTTAGLATPVTRTDSLLAVLNTIAAALTAIAAPGGLTSSSGPVSAAAAAPLIEAAVAAIAGAVETLPSGSSMVT